MYLIHKNEISRLKAYRQELADKYVEALSRHDMARARELFDLRRRVLRAILLRQEWEGADATHAAEHASLA